MQTISDLMEESQIPVDGLNSVFASLPADFNGTSLFDTRNLTTDSGRIDLWMQVAVAVAGEVVADSSRMVRMTGASCASSDLNEACLKTIIQNLHKRILRRPAQELDVQNYLALAQTGTSNEEKVEVLVMAMLQSPKFLYLIEPDATPQGDSAVEISLYELASRLSYSLTGTKPDAELMAKADDGSLSQPAIVLAQVDRLLGSPKAHQTFSRFYSQWLRLDKIPTPMASPSFRGGLDLSTLRDESIAEVSNIIDEVTWRQQGHLGNILTTDLVEGGSLNLGEIYGIAPGSQAGLVSLPSRPGLLSRAAFLLASGDVTQPIHRGVRVNLEILCQPLGSPPAAAQTAPPPVLSSPVSSREYFTRLTSAPACAGCHSMINPPGFVFERYDSLGRRRDTQLGIFTTPTTQQIPINSSVQFEMDNEYVQMADDRDFAKRLGTSVQANRCVNLRYLEFVRGREIASTDGCELQNMFERSYSQPRGLIEMMKTPFSMPQLRMKKIR